MSLSPPTDIPSVSIRARANNETDTMDEGPVATIKEAMGSCNYKRIPVVLNSTEETLKPVQVSPISRYSGDISIIGGRLSKNISISKGQIDSWVVYWLYTYMFFLMLSFYFVRFLKVCGALNASCR